MRNRIIYLAILLLVVKGLVFPEHISHGEAQITAYNWAEILRTEFQEEVKIVPGSCRVISKSGIDTAYVFDFEKKGFLIIPAEDYLPPIKFYTTSFDFSENEDAVRFQDFVFNNLERIIKEVKKRNLESNLSFASKNREFFRYLKVYHKFLQSRPAAQKEEVEPLLRTRWGQTGAENMKCPVVEGYRAPAGCVAIAIAQIMRYHEWPRRGRGSHSYTLPKYNIPLAANFDHEYQWDYMLDFYRHEHDGTEEEREAISTLMFDVGVSLEMFYTPYWSSVNPEHAVESLPRYFKYSKEIEFMQRFGYSSDEWFALAKSQIDQGLPIAFTIFGSDGGHEVAIDGYRSFDLSKTVHINFGWRGIDNGYYSLDNVPEFEELSQFFLINIKPPNYRYIKAPGNISGIYYRNRSLLMTEYHIYITWDESPTGGENIEKYVIYRKSRMGKERDKVKLAEIKTGQERVWKSITPHFDQREYEYTVVAVDSLGNTSKNPQWIRIEKAEL